jgi:hypothetical protein
MNYKVAYLFEREMVDFGGEYGEQWDIENPTAPVKDEESGTKKILADYITEALPGKIFAVLCGMGAMYELVQIPFSDLLSDADYLTLCGVVADYKALRTA